MAEAAAETTTMEVPSKKTKASGAKKPAKKPTHPKTSEMVIKAIADLKTRGGCSLQAIKKYIITNYTVDADRLAPFVKKYLINAVESGAVLRTKGKGAAGSFKLDNKTKLAVGKKEKASEATSPKKTGIKAGGIKKKKKPAVKAPATPPKKTAAVKIKKMKTPKKEKKSTKPPTKPKTPKPKKAGASRGRPSVKNTKIKK